MPATVSKKISNWNLGLALELIGIHTKLYKTLHEVIVLRPL